MPVLNGRTLLAAWAIFSMVHACRAEPPLSDLAYTDLESRIEAQEAEIRDLRARIDPASFAWETNGYFSGGPTCAAARRSGDCPS